jgi:ADP-ribose pyrophosphatase
MSSEIVTFYAARDVRPTGEQGERERAEIRVHVVALAGLVDWALERERDGVLVDPKVWAGLFLAARRP